MTDPFPPSLPHGPLEPVAPDVWIVRGSFDMGPGMRIGRTMTVLRAPDGLALVNSIRLDPAGEAALEALGPVRHVIKLANQHTLDDPYNSHRWDATFWRLEGARPTQAKTQRALGPDSPFPGAQVVRIEGIVGKECALVVPLGGGTLVTCDVLQNHVDGDRPFDGFLSKVMSPLLGYSGGVRSPSMWSRLMKPRDPQATFGPLGGHEVANLTTGHGPAVAGGASARIEAALRERLGTSRVPGSGTG